MVRWTVSADGSGDFTSVQAAVDAVRVHWEERTVIFIKNGVYVERVTIPDNKPMISLVGESIEGTILSFDDYARRIGPDGSELGTFRTPVLTVHGDDFIAQNLTVRNTAGYGQEIGQALAVYASGDRAVYANVRMLGNQDTLYTGKGRHYYKSCYIEGHVDYIFGSATAVFHDCEVHSLRGGYITAASTPEETEFGYVFLDCRLTGSAEAGTVFLGRPWRPHAHVMFVDTWMDSHIKPEGWDNWRNPDNEKTARYIEAGSYGPGAAPDKRVKWAKTINRGGSVPQLTVCRILAGSDEWCPVGQNDDKEGAIL